MALWTGLLGESELYRQIQIIKEKYLSHCNFQFWYPDESSEDHFYTNSDLHGATLSHAPIERALNEFVDKVFNESENSPHFQTLSAVQMGYWPIILIACRHYRLPVPLHLLAGFRQPLLTE
jgi:hypothetical protein